MTDNNTPRTTQDDISDLVKTWHRQTCEASQFVETSDDTRDMSQYLQKVSAIYADYRLSVGLREYGILGPNDYVDDICPNRVGAIRILLASGVVIDLSEDGSHVMTQSDTSK